MSKPWSVPTHQLCSELKTNRWHGLSASQARLRLKKGTNELTDNEHAGFGELLLRQLANPLILLLLFALVLTISQHKNADSIVIGLVVVANVWIGWYQESKAEATMRRLRQILSPQARVIRDSVEQKIQAKYLVVGDVVLLEPGDRVPADGRLLEVRGLQINQAALTGESLPVSKREGLLAPSTNLAERSNMAHLSTLVTEGRALMIVTAIGSHTELGRIAGEVGRLSDEPELITKQIGRLGLWLLLVALVLGAFLIFIGLAKGNDLTTMISVAISLVVSMVPEGLPIAFTVLLTVGLVRIFEAGALLRKLSAAETLGSVTVICVDKTGTLTEDKLMVEHLIVGGQELRVDGHGYGLTGYFYDGPQKDHKIEIGKQLGARLLLELSALSTMSTINPNDLKRDEAAALTDSTETALAVVAAKAGFYAFKEEREHPELLELPYRAKEGYTLSTHAFGKTNRLIIKGAPEEILRRCSHQISVSGQSLQLLKDSRVKLEETANAYAHQGYRVIALAYADNGQAEGLDRHAKKDFVFVGLLAMADPIRVEVRTAITEAQTAGVRVLILTGDHLLTAQAVCQRLGLDGRVIHQNDLTHHSLDGVSAVARLSPEQKLLIIERLQKKGEIVAMTGDGVNDAPALKKADIGIAMGRSGTDVAIEAADMVLPTNRFSAIVAAVREGRLIWQNLRKIIYHLVSTSLAEALILITAVMLGWPLPLVAVQILWMNLVTDGITSVPLAFEKPEENELSALASLKNRSLVDAPMLRRMLLATVVMLTGSLLVFRAYQNNLAYAQTAVLTTMVFFQIFNLFASRSETKSVFSTSLGQNKPLLGLFFLAFLLQLLAVYQPVANRLLHTVPLSVGTLFGCIGVGLLIVVADELRKWVVRLLKAWARTEQILASEGV